MKGSNLIQIYGNFGGSKPYYNDTALLGYDVQRPVSDLGGASEVRLNPRILNVSQGRFEDVMKIFVAHPDVVV